MLWLKDGEREAVRYDFDRGGEAAPEDVAAWVHADGGQTPRVKGSRRVSMDLPALDRMALLHWLRYQDLAPGASWTRRGAGPKGPLKFVATVEATETLETGRQMFD